MTIRRKSSEEQDEIRLDDGAATQRLREVENRAVVSRRGVLWRAGLATAAGVGVLSALDEQQAQAVTGGNFVLGNANDANATTQLHPTSGTSPNPLMQIDGSALSATAASLIVKGPAGGAAFRADGVSSNATIATIGLAIWGNATGSARGVVGSSGSNNGVEGASTSGTGVWGHSSSGAGVLGQSTTNSGVSGSSSSGVGVVGSSTSGDGIHGTTATNGKTGVLGQDTSSTGGNGVYGASTKGVGVRAASTSGTALTVSGKTHFSRSGAGAISTGTSSKAVSVSGMSASSLVLVTLQTAASGVYLASAVPGSGKFTVHLNKNAPKSIRFAWFVLAG